MGRVDGSPYVLSLAANQTPRGVFVTSPVWKSLLEVFLPLQSHSLGPSAHAGRDFSALYGGVFSPSHYSGAVQ